MKRATIRDIAERCGVSHTIVSAVLNRPWVRSRCSKEKCELIRQTARELHYQTNTLAQAMALQHVPVAALMLRSTGKDNIYREVDFSDRAPRFMWAMQEYQIEVLTVFYRNEEEQVERFESLLSRGLIGGVASNIIPFSHRKILKAFRNSGIPYVVFGHPAVPALSVRMKNDYSFVKEAHRRLGTRKCFLMQEENNAQILFPYEDVEDYDRFDYKPVPAVDEITNDPGNLILILGSEFYLRSERKFAHPLILERSLYKYLIPDGVSYALYDPDTVNCEKTGADLLYQWMQGKQPAEQEYRLPDRPPAELVIRDKRNEIKTAAIPISVKDNNHERKTK